MRYKSYKAFDHFMMEWIKTSELHSDGFEFNCRDMQCKLIWGDTKDHLKIMEMETIDTKKGLRVGRLIMDTHPDLVDDSFYIEGIIHSYWKEKKKNEARQ